MTVEKGRECLLALSVVWKSKAADFLRGNSATTIRLAGSSPRDGCLKPRLKSGQSVFLRLKGGVKVLNGMFERIGMTPDRRHNDPAECTAQDAQSSSPTLQKVVEAIQRQAVTALLPGGLDGNQTNQCRQCHDGPEEGRGKGMAGDDMCEEYRIGSATTTSVSAIGAEDALAAPAPARGQIGMIPVQEAVEIKRADLAAEGTPARLEQKTSGASSFGPFTKMTGDLCIRRLMPNPCQAVQHFQGTGLNQIDFRRGGRDGADGTYHE